MICYNYGNRLQEVLRNIIIKKKKRCDYEVEKATDKSPKEKEKRRLSPNPGIDYRYRRVLFCGI